MDNIILRISVVVQKQRPSIVINIDDSALDDALKRLDKIQSLSEKAKKDE